MEKISKRIRAEEPESVGATAGWEKKQEPEQEPLQKKPVAGAGDAKNMPLLYRLLEDKKHIEIVYLLLFFR